MSPSKPSLCDLANFESLRKPESHLDRSIRRRIRPVVSSSAIAVPI